MLLYDRFFFVNVNLRPRIKSFRPDDYPLLIDAIEEARKRLKFLFCGYALIPQSRDALIYPAYPLTISKVLHYIKKIATLRIHAAQGQWHVVSVKWRASPTAGLFGLFDYLARHSPLVTHHCSQSWSSYNNFSLNTATAAACPIQIDYVRLPEAYRG